MFITLTRKLDDYKEVECDVNLDAVTWMQTEANGTLLKMSDGPDIIVKESRDEIKKLGRVGL